MNAIKNRADFQSLPHSYWIQVETQTNIQNKNLPRIQIQVRKQPRLLHSLVCAMQQNVFLFLFQNEAQKLATQETIARMYSL